MITKPDITALWLDACPSFAPVDADSCGYRGEELLYVHAGDFAWHLLALHRTGQQEEFPAVVGFIERLHVEGDQWTREFATIDILEAIQNVWGHTDVPPDEFLPFLLPASAAAWHSLNRFWAGEVPFAPDPAPSPSAMAGY